MQFEDNPYSASEVDEPTGDIVERPKTATILGAIHVAFGVVGILLMLVGILFQALGNVFDGGNDLPEEVQAVLESDANQVANLALSGVDFAVTMLLISAGVGLMRFRMWGRTLSLIWGGLSIVMSIVRATVGVFLTLLPLQEVAGPDPSPELSVMLLVTMFGGICGTLVALIYPIVVLVLMNRKGFVSSLKYTQDRIDAANRGTVG